MSNLTTSSVAAELIEFVAPGLLHGLGNRLFAIHGHAQMLRGGGEDVDKERGAILKASDAARQTLEVFRYLLGERAADASPHAGKILCNLLGTISMSLRDHGLRVDLEEDVGDVPVRADGVALCQCVVQVLRALAPEPADGLQRRVRVGVQASDQGTPMLVFMITPGDACLPFPADAKHVTTWTQPMMELHAAHLDVAATGDRVTLELPRPVTPE